MRFAITLAAMLLALPAAAATVNLSGSIGGGQFDGTTVSGVLDYDLDAIYDPGDPNGTNGEATAFAPDGFTLSLTLLGQSFDQSDDIFAFPIATFIDGLPTEIAFAVEEPFTQIEAPGLRGFEIAEFVLTGEPGPNGQPGSAEIRLTATTAPVPLPASLPLLLAGAAGLGFVARRRRLAAG